jgi:hypothetical protein
VEFSIHGSLLPRSLSIQTDRQTFATGVALFLIQ